MKNFSRLAYLSIMKKYRLNKWLWCMSTIIALASCSSDKGEITGEEISLSMNEAENIDDMPAKDTDTIYINYPDSVPLGSISRIYPADDMFVIVDHMNQPYGFTQKGKYVCQYGSHGEAPMEYVNMGACAISNDNVVICDSYKHQMLFYNLKTGEFSRNIDFPYGSLNMVQQCVFASDTTAMLARYVFNQSNSVFAKANLENKTVTDFASVPMHTDNMAMPIGWNAISSYEGTTIYIKPFSPYIYKYPETKCFYINQSEPVYSEAELSAIEDFSIMTYAKAMSNGYFAGFTDIFELKDWIFLAFQDVEFYLINKHNWKLSRFKYEKDDFMNFTKITKIIGTIPQKNALIGVNNRATDEDRFYIYYLESN